MCEESTIGADVGKRFGQGDQIGCLLPQSTLQGVFDGCHGVSLGVQPEDTRLHDGSALRRGKLLPQKGADQIVIPIVVVLVVVLGIVIEEEILRQ